MVSRQPRFGRRSSLCVIIAFTIWCQVVLASEDDAAEAGQQRWYEKGWKRTSAPSTIGGADEASGSDSRLWSKAGGSGAGAISDLDEVAPGLGEDDEDADDMEIGSGDMDLPFATSPVFSPPVPATLPSTLPSGLSSSRLPPDESATTRLYAVHNVIPEDHHQPAATVTTAPSTKKNMMSNNVTSGGVSRSKTTPRPTSTPKKGKGPKLDDRNQPHQTSFWMRPGVLAGLIGGAVAGLLAAILLVMFVVYRMRKKDEGSYALEEPKSSPPNYAYAYQKAPTKEFYA